MSRLLLATFLVYYSVTIVHATETYNGVPYTALNKKQAFLQLFLLQNVKPEDVKFRLYTQASQTEPELIINGNNFEPLRNHKSFNPHGLTMLPIHGWMGKLDEPVNKDVRINALTTGIANVFVVDWTGPSQIFYLFQEKIVQQVGNIVGKFVSFLQQKLQIPCGNIIIVGFSLGAHVAGFSGKYMKSINQNACYIVGLDPAGVLYEDYGPSRRLSNEDANFVQVIHCSSNQGYYKPIGDVDFYPNNGKNQPGCPENESLLQNCSHMRCPVLYAEGLLNPCSFISRKATSYENFQKNVFIEKPTSMVWVNDQTITGNYYLETDNKPLYSLSSTCPNDM